MGFGGQWGYYTDTETRLLSLTHRYYDAGAGRFLNRDPIGYKGGINVYAFGVDGLRERYLPGSTLSYAYSYDPQGNTQTRTSDSPTLAYTYNDALLYDAYGGFRYDQTSGGTSFGYTRDPIGFGGQWGYYTDTETQPGSRRSLP